MDKQDRIKILYGKTSRIFVFLLSQKLGYNGNNTNWSKEVQLNEEFDSKIDWDCKKKFI